jgi:uncharacterized protein YjdB
MRLRRHARTAAALAVIALVGACGMLVDPVCTSELGWEITPTARTLAVGQTLTPSGTIVTCGGRDREPAQLVLVITDSTIVTLAADARSVTAVGLGTAQVLATDARYGPLGYITVTVVPQD